MQPDQDQSNNTQPEIQTTEEPQAPPVVTQKPGVPKRKIIIISSVVLLILALAAASMLIRQTKRADSNAPSQKSTAVTTTSDNSVKAQGVQLDPTKNYGDKYAKGILPVGDKKYSSTEAKQGYVYACSGYANNLSQTQNGGAGRQGPWFSSDGKTYDINKKLQVQGNVTWQPSFSNNVSGSTRTITTNDLPDHTTGIFPISAKDPAYAYDRNPNSIKAQTINYALNPTPTYGTPQCIGGQVGVMLSGVLLFSSFDAEGRDAGAWEVQDSCGGHPEKTGEYHYHTLSSCIKNIDTQTVIGFALDGFPITGPRVSAGNVLTTSDLDECHGLTSKIVLDGKTVTSYHYVMTQDFPYSVSCFRSTPLTTLPAGAPPHA